MYGLGRDSDEAVLHSGWFNENLIAQALVMVLPHTGRRGAGGGLSPVGWAATVLAAIGVLLPLSRLGPPPGMTAPPLAYYGQLAAVLTLYAAALAMAMRRRERRHAERGGVMESSRSAAWGEPWLTR